MIAADGGAGTMDRMINDIGIPTVKPEKEFNRKAGVEPEEKGNVFLPGNNKMIYDIPEDGHKYVIFHLSAGS